MQLIAPDVLTEAHGLSPGISGTAIGIGVLVWLTGWRLHRFWFVLTLTVGAGVAGLNEAAVLKVHPVAAGVLVAVAVGVLSLSLVRVLAFVSAGLAACVVVHAALPAWNQPLGAFVGGGLLGLYLFRLWTMMLTSTAGAMLMVYGGLCLADKLAKWDAGAWAGRKTQMLNWVCLAVAAGGLGLQYFFDRKKINRTRKTRDKESGGISAKREPKPWWSFDQMAERLAG